MRKVGTNVLDTLAKYESIRYVYARVYMCLRAPNRQ